MDQDNSRPQNPPENDIIFYWNIALRRKWVILSFFFITVVLTGFISFRQNNVYRATVQVLIEKETSSSNGNRETVNLDVTGLDYYMTQYKIIKSLSLAQKVIDDLKLQNNPEFAVEKGDPTDKFLKHVIVEPIRGSRLVNLSFESRSPELAANVANTLAETYVKMNLANRLFASHAILGKITNGINSADYSATEVQSLPSIVSNPLIQALKIDLIKYEAEYANLSQRYKIKHPSMLTLGARITFIKGQLNNEIRNTLESIKTELSGEFKTSSVSIVDYARVPSEPVRPRRLANIGLACFLGLTMGGMLAIFMEYMDDTLKSGIEIEKVLNIPFLGFIPIVKTGVEGHFIIENSNTPEAESIKLIRTNLVFSSPEEKLKTILVTSSTPGEGKTFSALNIAVSFARAGKRTLIIDADLRRSSLSKFIKVAKMEGLSNYVIGSIAIDKIIQPTEIENLNFISAGTKVPDPAVLLGSEKMKDLVKEIKTSFDRIIIDSAPILSVSDTLNIAGIMDGVVQIILCGKVSRNVAGLCNRKLSNVGARLFGAILNRVNTEIMGNNKDSYYGYGKYY